MTEERINPNRKDLIMTSLYQLQKRADSHGYAVRKEGGLHAVVDISHGGTTHRHDDLNCPYTLTREEVKDELDRLI